MHSRTSENLFAFTLGRESKLSLAELFALFWKQAYLNHTDEVAIFSLPYEDIQISAIFRNIGGSVRVMRLIGETDEKRFPTDVIREIWKPEGKYGFALGVYGGEFRLSDIGLRIKKTLKDSWVSVRLVNIENKNIVSAVFKKEKLAKSQSEYNLLHLEWISYIAVTLACQDIDAYTKRDTGKARDMEVGMMPPKLAQMMINIASEWKRNGVYDPFCGLGTILIESANMWILEVIWSDMSAKMVSSTEKSLSEFIAEEKVWHERIRAKWGIPSKDFSNFKAQIFQMDSSKITRNSLQAHIVESLQSWELHIISEGYLGEIMQKDSITMDRVKQERSKLRNMYDGFFGGLCGLDFGGNLIMTFPFWEVHGTTSFFTEIHDVIGRHWFEVIPLLPPDMRTLMTPKGTLLYKRPGQNVGREVTKVRLRKDLWKK